MAHEDNYKRQQSFALENTPCRNLGIYLLCKHFSRNPEMIKVLCEQTRELHKRIKIFFGLCLVLSGLGNIVVDFHI